MSSYDGNFVWYELMTTDSAAAAEFYSGVTGWRAADSGMPGMSYTLLWVGDSMVGGLMDLPPEAAGARPGWVGYIAVEDVDAFAARVTEAGGSVHKAPGDIPGIGRFAVVADPQGAVFVLFKGASDGEPPPPPAPGTPGHFGWHELHAGEWESAFAFYAAQFGWKKTEAVDMGPMGIYQTFATGGAAGDGMIGGMMTKNEAMPMPFWLYYVNVEDIEAGVARVRDKGGQVLQGPHQVPGGLWIAQALDPQGAMFAILGPHA